jgi:Immunoglobulin I-set domain
MKSFCKNLSTTLLALGAILLGSPQSQAQITVKVDSTKTWAGYLNVFTTNNGYVYGQAFGAVDLRARFVPAQTNATKVVLNVNTNTYNPADPFWNLPDGTPNKHLEANFYVDVGTTLAGNDVTFVGTVESNSLPEGWTCEAVVKQFAGGYAYIGDTRQALVGGESFSVTRNIPAGNICQYGFLLYGPNAAPNSPAALQGVSILVDNADPSITTEPVSKRVLIGGSNSFTVVATGSSALSYQWQRDSTNLLNGGNISGATSPTLTINNAQLADASTYSVIVTNLAGSATSQTVRLRVLTPTEFANLLDNPSFEQDVVAFQVVPDPWFNFTGSALLSGGEFIFGTAYDGTNVVQIYNAGQYNGIYQDVPASPGQIFTGDGWLWQSSSDPLSAPINEAFLEVQFWPAAGAPIAIYHSTVVTTNSTQDAWMHLVATNGVAAGYATISTANANYLVAPAGTHHVRFQMTTHAEGGGSGSVFVDAMRLLQKIPVTLSAAPSGGNIAISWLSQVGTSYQVVYKDNITDSAWTPVGGTVAGDGSTKTASFPATATQRFYSVLTL